VCLALGNGLQHIQTAYLKNEFQSHKNMAVSVLHLKLYGNLCILDKIKENKKNNFEEVKQKVYCGNQ